MYHSWFDGAELRAITPNGSILWSYKSKTQIVSAPAISPDGTIYVAAADRLLALSEKGILKWSFAMQGTSLSRPAIGENGTVYIGSAIGELFAVNSNGSIIWSHETGDSKLSSAAIGQDGTIYISSNEQNLYAINNDGSEKWLFTTGLSYPSILQEATSPVIAKDGTIFVGSNDQLLAIHSNGNLKWSFQAAYQFQISTPTVANDGTVYFGTDKLYAIDSDAGPLSNSAWPKLGQNAQNTGRYKTDTDGDGVEDSQDAFPLDPSRSQQPEDNSISSGGGTTLWLWLVGLFVLTKKQFIAREKSKPRTTISSSSGRNYELISTTTTYKC